MKHLYQILAIQPGASADEIKRAYYLLAKTHHPDSGDRAEVKKFYEVTEAYQILSVPERRAAYDRTLKTGKLEKCSENLTSLRSQMLWIAIFKVLLTVFAAGVIGRTLAILLAISPWPGSFAGAAFGLVWAANRHFEVASFLASPAQARLVRWGGRALMAFSVGYFAAALLLSLFPSRV